MTNSADPDQLASLDLHCLLRQGMSCLAREGLTHFRLNKLIPHCILEESNSVLGMSGYMTDIPRENWLTICKQHRD